MTDTSFDSLISQFGALTSQTLDEVSRNHPLTKDSPCALRESVTAYRDALKRLFDDIAEQHFKNPSGLLTCALLTECIDRLITHIQQVFFNNIRPDSGFAIAALGGYGRKELNPFSDVDLLFLSNRSFDDSQSSSINVILRFLWDMNLDLGHSTRTIDECIETAGGDSYLATSLLEARFLTGNRSIWDTFADRFGVWLAGGDGRQFAMKKIEERIKRLEYYHNTVHIREPNIKECPGTLRDIHTARWLMFPAENGAGAFFSSRLFSGTERQVFDEGLDFLLRTRNTLHFIAGKKADVLDHLSLPDVAGKLGYRGAGVVPIEEFMHDYYWYVGRIRHLTDRIVDDYLDSISGSGGGPFMQVTGDISANDKAVRLVDRSVESIVRKPDILVEVCAVAGARSLRLTRTTSSLVEESSQRLSHVMSRNPEVIVAFHDLINMREGIARSLRLMHEHGVLVQLIPEFEGICCHYQYDFYHTYTTDEHSLRVIQNLENIATGKNSADPGLPVLMQDVTARSALYLAGLLHDIGKSGGSGHALRGERMASRVLRRLRFDERTIQLVRFLIREHLLLSHTSQRRDIDDEDTINDFVERVNNAGRLKMLTLLTFADLMALSETALNDWKRALLWNLYKKALMLIDRDFESTVHRSQTNRIHRLVRTLSASLPRQTVREHLDNLPEQYLRVTTTAVIKQHIMGIARMKKRGAWASFRRDGELSTITVIAPDYPSALSDICGAITSSDINIVRAQIFTRNDGIIIDTFHVVSGSGEPLIPPESQREFKRNLPKIIAGELNVRDLIASHIHRWRRRRKNVVYAPPRVKFHNDISSKYTVIDVFANDYTGLLYDITSVLATNGIDIHTARIGTDEDQVTDAFYIRKDGRKIEDRATIEKLTGEIIERLTGERGF